MFAEGAIHRFSRLLDLYPAGFAGNRLNLLFVEDAAVIGDGLGFLRNLDGLSLLDERREYLLDDQVAWPFPRVQIADRPDPWWVSERLFDRFEEARLLLPTQGDIAEGIDRKARERSPEVIALIIVDGLSYYDLPAGIAGPYLVDGVSITEYGYPRIVGQPSISRRLFALGYVQQMGFTYFDTSANTLSADIYSTFSPSQITRIRAFEEVLRSVQEAKLTRAYIQVSLAGLDQISHAHWDRPPKEHYIERLLADYYNLLECLAANHRHVLVALTSDHGILWREVMEGREQIASDLFSEDIRSPRFIKGILCKYYGKCCRSNGQNYTLLRVPWMTRRFNINEWGVHGGISAWESLVPLLMNET